MRVAPKAGAAMLSLLLAGSGVGAVVGVPGVANAQDAAAMVRLAAASDLVVTDNYPALYGWLANSLSDATTVKIATTCGVSDRGNGTTTIPAQVTQLVGWQAKSWFDEEGEKVRQLGYASSYETLTFASGATTEVRSLTLKLLDDRLVVRTSRSRTARSSTASKSRRAARPPSRTARSLRAQSSITARRATPARRRSPRTRAWQKARFRTSGSLPPSLP